MWFYGRCPGDVDTEKSVMAWPETVLDSAIGWASCPMVRRKALPNFLNQAERLGMTSGRGDAGLFERMLARLGKRPAKDAIRLNSSVMFQSDIRDPLGRHAARNVIPHD